MSLDAPTKRKLADLAGVLGRWLLGGLFIYMGLNKALHPVDFLKLVRQYELVAHPYLLNSIAAALPWFEVFCGLLLVAGVVHTSVPVVEFAKVSPVTKPVTAPARPVGVVPVAIVSGVATYSSEAGVMLAVVVTEGDSKV